MSYPNMKVYIAAPFFTDDQLFVVRKIENILRENGIEFFSPRSEGTLKEMTALERADVMGDLFKSNISHMDWCTHCIAMIDDYDTGTVWEMGYLYATKKHIVTFSPNYFGINVMLNESIAAHCVEYHDLIVGLEGSFKGNKTSEVK